MSWLQQICYHHVKQQLSRCMGGCMDASLFLSEMLGCLQTHVKARVYLAAVRATFFCPLLSKCIAKIFVQETVYGSLENLSHYSG